MSKLILLVFVYIFLAILSYRTVYISAFSPLSRDSYPIHSAESLAFAIRHKGYVFVGKYVHDSQAQFLLKNERLKYVEDTFIRVHDKTLIPGIIAEKEGSIALSGALSSYIRTRYCHLQLSDTVDQIANVAKGFMVSKNASNHFKIRLSQAVFRIIESGVHEKILQKYHLSSANKCLNPSEQPKPRTFKQFKNLFWSYLRFEFVLLGFVLAENVVALVGNKYADVKC